MKNIALTGMMGCGKSTVAKELKKLLQERFIWHCDGEIEDGKYPIVDDTHKVLSGENGELLQYSYIEDECAKIFRIGFTVEEVEKLIGE